MYDKLEEPDDDENVCGATNQIPLSLSDRAKLTTLAWSHSPYRICLISLLD